HPSANEKAGRPHHGSQRRDRPRSDHAPRHRRLAAHPHGRPQAARSRTGPSRRARVHRLDPRPDRPLAALLSTRGEFTPVTAHQANVEGTLNLLEFAQNERQSHGRPVTFLYPSSIAAYGLPDLATKSRAGKVKEDDFNQPTTMYGCNKLYAEHLGRYYSRHYKQLSSETVSSRVVFRCMRFP